MFTGARDRLQAISRWVTYIRLETGLKEPVRYIICVMVFTSVFFLYLCVTLMLQVNDKWAHNYVEVYIS